MLRLLAVVTCYNCRRRDLNKNANEAKAQYYIFNFHPTNPTYLFDDGVGELLLERATRRLVAVVGTVL